uniref:Uncharacterized protein n=1 Tax=Rhizophora mucronata TaxID=61149 RepID=A0A2P2N4B2_RHIMU
MFDVQNHNLPNQPRKEHNDLNHSLCLLQILSGYTSWESTDQALCKPQMTRPGICNSSTPGLHCLIPLPQGHMVDQ